MSVANAGLAAAAESAAAEDPRRGSITSEIGYGDVETSDDSDHPVAPDQFDPKVSASALRLLCASFARPDKLWLSLVVRHEF